MTHRFPFLCRVFDKETGKEIAATGVATAAEAIDTTVKLMDDYPGQKHESRILILSSATDEEFLDLRQTLAKMNISLEATF